MMSPDVTPELVAQKIRDARGNISAAAISLHVSRQALYRYIEKHATLKAVIAESRETMLDMVESVLYQKALEGESWAVCFFLKTQGKQRGYVERSEVSGPNEGPIQVATVFDHGSAIAGLAPRPIRNHQPSGEGESGSDGPALGENVHGG